MEAALFLFKDEIEMAAFDGTLRTREQEGARIAETKLPSWIAGVTVHAVSAPNMKQARETPYPQGNKMLKGPDMDKAFAQRLRNFKTRVNQIGGRGWHVTAFENGKLGEGCALTDKGIHASTWNVSTLGIEMCFDGDSNDPLMPGGKVILDSAAWWVAQILKGRFLGVNSQTVRFHNDEPAAKRRLKTCPGSNVNEKSFAAMVSNYMSVPQPVNLVSGIGPVRDIQTHLIKHGYDPGPIDGIWGNRTQAAVASFQEALGLSGVASSGKVGPYTWIKLMGPVRSPMAVSEPIKPSVPLSPPPVQPKGDYLPIADLHPSDFAISWMKRFEGLRLEAYDDVGSYAIGWGHNASSNRPPSPYKGMKITEAEAVSILAADAEAISAEVRKVLKGTMLTQNQFDALVLDNFQRGQTQFTKSAHVQLIKSGKDASSAFHAASDRTANAGLKRRRKVQAQIYDGDRPTKW